MRQFDYSKYTLKQWDNEILNYLTQIHEFKGKQELYARQKPVELERLVEVAKVQSVESSNRIEGIVTTGSRLGQIVAKKLLRKEGMRKKSPDTVMCSIRFMKAMTTSRLVEISSFSFTEI